MRAVVTGGAGFIGSAVVDRLVAGGHDVHVIDNFSSGSLDNVAEATAAVGKRLVVHELDIRSPRCTELIAELSPEVVFHLAAQIDVRVSVQDPVLDAEINVIGSLRVFEGARRAGARKVIFASSGGTIYGEPDVSALPVDETHPQLPVSPYGVAKKVASDYLYAYARLHGLDFTSLALANVYGPRQDPHGEAGVVAIFCGRLLDRHECVIFGDGEQTRDFVYVADVADAFVRAAASNTASATVLNIGTGVETSVNELYGAIAEAAGIDAPPTHGPARPGELQRSAISPGLAARTLGWVPSTDLLTGTASTLEWFRVKRG
jgi:UDP-glucose 4-epimerase